MFFNVINTEFVILLHYLYLFNIFFVVEGVIGKGRGNKSRDSLALGGRESQLSISVWRRLLVFNSHLVERAVGEENGNSEEDQAEPGSDVTETFADGYFHGEDTEEGGELDDGVECHRGGVFEGVADGVADNACIV